MKYNWVTLSSSSLNTSFHYFHSRVTKNPGCRAGHTSSCTIINPDKVTLFFPQPTRLMENFLEIASNNTKKDIETCGVLGAILVRSLVFTLLSRMILLEHCWTMTSSYGDVRSSKFFVRNFFICMTGYENFKQCILKCQTCRF